MGESLDGRPVASPAGAAFHEAIRRCGHRRELVGWPIFAIVTVAAMLGEMFTRFAEAGAGYYFIMLGMPAFCIAWLTLLIYASFRPVPTRWPVAALLAALVIIAGYATIG